MGILSGRLGLDTSRIPHADRHGIVWLSRGHLVVEDGCVRFVSTAGFDIFPAGTYDIPHQSVSCICLGPGSMASHDVHRTLSVHGTCLLFVGDGGVRLYAYPQEQTDISDMARAQVRLWADEETRIMVARRMYAWRFGEILPHVPLADLRGMEGARVKRLYSILGERHGVPWMGRKYDRENPELSNDLNMGINHAATAAYAAAAIAVRSVGCVPQLGFIHESSGDSLCLDMADLYRMSHIVPLAFRCVAEVRKNPSLNLEREVRLACGRLFTQDGLVGLMIDKLKELFDADGSRGDQKR